MQICSSAQTLLLFLLLLVSLHRVLMCRYSIICRYKGHFGR